MRAVQRTKNAAAAAADGPGAGRRVLVVDDDRDFAVSVAELLRLEGYRVVVFSTSRFSLADLDDARPEVAVVDLRLDEASGLEVVAELTARWKDLVCMVMTAYASTETAVEAMKVGAYDYLRKPFPPEDFLRAVRRCFDRADLVASRARAEAALRESEERFRNLVESTTDWVWETDPADRLVYASPRVLDLLGYAPADVIGRTRASLIDERVEGGDAAALAAALRRRVPFRLLALPFRGRDGETVWLESSGRPVEAGPGRPGGYRGVDRDVTRRRALEAEAKARELQLVRASRMAALGTLVSGVAHEINNPNNLILMNAELIGECWRDAAPLLDAQAGAEPELRLAGIPYPEMRDQVPALVEDVKDGARRIRRIVEELKGFAQPVEVGLPVDVDLNSVASGALRLLAPLARKRATEIDLDLAPEPVTVRGERVHLEQVVVNLLVNAFEALPTRGGSVRIGTRRRADRVLLEVEDRGAGIPSEHLDKLFDPFFTTKQAQGGTGLGLAITHRLVEAHGGEIRVESQIGHGTRIEVDLPAAKPEAALTGGSPAAGPGSAR